MQSESHAHGCGQKHPDGYIFHISFSLVEVAGGRKKFLASSITV
jgi:hypothetical protein